ncbi:MAG: DUF3800 domain-containing protein [Clostridiales bacterium]|nr:DUF3800 domain-containing protein [Clostridiales bacterium]MCF8021617.1 DUF3800 domain-containing protein [Clostridiales bacterium]
MQDPKDQTTYFFVDESGDTTFLNKKGKWIVGQEGVSKILLLGFVKTKDPKTIRQTLNVTRKELINDPYLQDIPSLEKTAVSFHAKDDCPEVRYKVYKTLAELDFTAQIVVARKTKKVFDKFEGKPDKLYDYLISQLFRNSLHKSSYNKVYFATRGNRKRQEPLRKAIYEAIKMFESKWSTKVETSQDIYAQSPSDEVCLQVIDYINWAVQRVFTTGEMRYFNSIQEKVRLIVDLYDYKKNWGNFYSKKNPFHANKISPL